LRAQRVKRVATLTHGQLVLNKLEEVKIIGLAQLITFALEQPSFESLKEIKI
jgi:hypothetical protein